MAQKWHSQKLVTLDSTSEGHNMASINKRGNYWRAQIRRKGFPIQSSTFDTKSQAEAWVRTIEGGMDRGVFLGKTEADTTTLSAALDRYWNEIASKKKHFDPERLRIARWKRNVLAPRFLSSLKGIDFAQYRDERRAQGKAENTIRLELALMSHLFNIARKEWGMESLANPLNNIRKPSGSLERDRRLQDGEFEKIYQALAQSENHWVLPAFELAIETSLRQTMLFELRWDWVDLDKRVIRIPIEFRSVGNKGVPVAIPLSTRAANVIQNLPRSLDGRLLSTTSNAARCVWKRTLKEIGVKGLRWHDLRHEAASRLFEKGLHPLEVASITGHKSLTMLRRYTHLRPEDLALKLA